MTIADSTWGAYLIGVVVSAVLYGVTCVQTWYYFLGYPTDPWHVKLLVIACLVSDTVHQALITHSIYVYLVTDLGQPTMLAQLVWSLIIEVLFNAITAYMVQCFLAMRVYRLSNKNLFATMAVMSAITAEFVMSLIFVSKGIRMKTFLDLQTLKAQSAAINAITAVSDVLIAGLLCMLLHRSRTGFRRSDTMITKLMLFSVNTGLVTSVCAVASLISITVRPNAFIYIAFYFCMGRLYSNSLLATLNARRIIRGTSQDDEQSLSLQGIKRVGAQSMRTGSERPNGISIKIDTTHELVRDEYSAGSGDVKTPDV